MTYPNPKLDQPASLATGDAVGPYQVVRLLACTPVTEICEAVDAEGRRVALKVLRPHLRREAERLDLLRRECEVGRKLHHPRIIETYDFLDGDIPCIVLELYAAPNLKEVLRAGVEQIAWYAHKIIHQAADALAYCHSRGWIHRDIKPDNFLIGAKGNVKLIDFALAQRRRSGLARCFGGGAKVQGTRSYMSPEQIRGEAPDERADVYSFGCTIYEMVTGRLPLSGENPDDVLMKHLKKPPPPPATFNSELNREFNDLVQRMLSKKPGDRPPTMQAFLKEFAGMTIFRNTPPKPRDEDFPFSLGDRSPG